MPILDTLKGIHNVISGAIPDDQLSPENKGGFEARTRYTADGDGLPFQKQTTNNVGVRKRNIISWLIPEFGIIKMYVNPSRITYTDNKLITEAKTKGGYTLQYWGEALTTLNISGTTGSSGIEGINALYEIYRAEQLAFDTQGLVLDSNNATDIADNLANQASGALSGLLGNDLGGALSGVLGIDTTNYGLSGKLIPSIAQYAFTVEMYYSGAVYRGFFKSMTVTESADNFAFNYDINFVVTQKRGYRRNYFPFHRNPEGPSSYNSPYTFASEKEGEQIEPIE